MPTGRERVISYGETTGSITNNFTGTTDHVTVSNGSSKCIDVIGNFPNDNPLFIERRSRKPGVISGSDSTSEAPVYTFDTYPYEGQPAWDYVPFYLTAPMSNSDAVRQVMGETNPSRAIVSLPNLLYELREIPRYLFDRFTGRAAMRTKKGNNSIAEGAFHWENLYRDFAELVDFSKQIEERCEELRRLASGKGLRRSRTTWKESSSIIQPQGFQSSGGVFASGSRHYESYSEQWVSITWRPTGVPDFGNAAEMRSLAAQLIHGWRISPATIWEALPWSWLSDYFIDIGGYLEATRNNIDVVPTSCCVCEKHKIIVTDTVSAHTPGLTVSSGSSRTETKSRWPDGTFLPTAHVPFLSGKQLFVLSSIALGRS